MSKHAIGIIGATGYTGSELVRILLNHEEVEIAIITSESRKGEWFSSVHPQFTGIFDLKLSSMDDLSGYDLEVVFLALPHGVSMEFVKKYHEAPFRIIDLSGDFRLSSAAVYAEWYKQEHQFEKGFEGAAFGLPELFRNEIAASRLIANPGCFPTSSILPLAPLVKEKIADPAAVIIVDAKTGVTGAGIKAKATTHFPVVNDNFTAYGVKSHRHTIEIQEIISRFGENNARVLFTPHLLPVDRGILATCYIKPARKVSENELRDLYQKYYGKEHFIRLRAQLPDLKQVRGTNFCDLYCTYDERTDTILAIGVIDNLVKGAAGQAVQNMNILLGIEEQKGLNTPPLQP